MCRLAGGRASTLLASNERRVGGVRVAALRARWWAVEGNGRDVEFRAGGVGGGEVLGDV